MDHDDPNLNSASKDYQDWWQGVVKEQQAKAEKLSAEERLEHNDALNNFTAEVGAAADWAAADWEQFKGRVQQWTNSAEIEADKAV